MTVVDDNDPTPRADTEAVTLAALQRGDVVLLPTDTVYGLCADARQPQAVSLLYETKGRETRQPIAILAASVEDLCASLPGLSDGVSRVLEALLPGPYTFVVTDGNAVFAHLAGETQTVGVRVPILSPPVARIIEAVGLVAATSANLPGEPPARGVCDVPSGLLARVASVFDLGELPGTPSTIIDLTSAAPGILREGAVPADTALAAVHAALGQAP